MSARTRVAATGAALVVAVLAAGPARAAEAAGESPMALLLELVNILILVAAVVYFARKPVQAYFAERRRVVQHEIDAAAELLARAERRHAEWQRKLAELDREFEQIRTNARERAHEERARILAEAREAAERIRRDATAAVDQELRLARATLRAEASSLAMELAERILREQVTSTDNERLVEEFIESVGRGEGPARPEASVAAGGRG